MNPLSNVTDKAGVFVFRCSINCLLLNIESKNPLKIDTMSVILLCPYPSSLSRFPVNCSLSYFFLLRFLLDCYLIRFAVESHSYLSPDAFLICIAGNSLQQFLLSIYRGVACDSALSSSFYLFSLKYLTEFWKFQCQFNTCLITLFKSFKLG